MESERERLGRLYEELGDDHLRDLAEEPDALTDDARLALSAEMRRRGFAPEPAEPIVATVEPERETGFGPGIPGVFPASASMMEQALEPSQTPKDGLSTLISFYDVIELAKACAILEDDGMEPVIEPIAGDAMSGVPPRFEVWLDSRVIEHAKTLLRAGMGLFPLAEVAAGGNDTPLPGDTSVDSRMVVGQFETRVEAEEVRAMLAGEGFRVVIETDSDDPALSLVTVPAAEQELALDALARRMGLQ